MHVLQYAKIICGVAGICVATYRYIININKLFCVFIILIYLSHLRECLSNIIITYFYTKLSDLLEIV